VLSGGVEILVSTVRNGSVRLAIVAPRGVLVLRGEIHDRIAEANASASTWDGANVVPENVSASVIVDENAADKEEKVVT